MSWLGDSFVETAESVTEGHPDKVADQISDAILDAHLREDPRSRVACEVFLTGHKISIGGEITSRASVDYRAVVEDVIHDIGYEPEEVGLHNGIDNHLTAQSTEIEKAIGDGGAGDQGIMIGYACDETDSLMPYPITLAHDLTRELTRLRKQGILPYLRPDGKSQVTVNYRHGEPDRIETVVVSTLHRDGVGLDQLRGDLKEKLIHEVLPSALIDQRTELLLNSGGPFTRGGPVADTGLTGRKLVVDAYGPRVPIGGGAFSGKDPTKVDRTGNYAARYMAQNVVAAGLAEECLIRLSYAIGARREINLSVNTFGTSNDPDFKIATMLKDVFSFGEDGPSMDPAGFRSHLNLDRPIYRTTAAYGHFGRSPDGDKFPWEQTDRLEPIQSDSHVGRSVPPLPAADTCVVCGRTLEETGGKRIVAVPDGTRIRVYERSTLEPESDHHFEIGDRVLSVKGQPLGEADVQRARETVKRGDHPWACSDCVGPPCSQCGGGLAYPQGCEVISQAGIDSHCMIVPAVVSCTNPDCENYGGADE